MRILKSNSILKIFNNYLYDSLLPINISYFYNYGSILGFFLIIQIITGIFLAMYYIPNIDYAFNSIEYIMREVNYGWLIRYLHSNGAALFFLAVYLHMLRGILYGSYNKKITWIIGVIIFLLMIITAFIGYSLVWGQMSYWAVTVITNLLTTIPYLGQSIVYLIWGSFSVTNATLNRFYSFHYLFPFIIAFLSLIHLVALHTVGGSNPLGINRNTINFNPYFTIQDILGIIFISILYLFLIFFYPNFLNHPDNYIEANPLVTPNHIVPELYLLPFYAILRAITNKTLGVIAMICSILILILLSFTNIHFINTSFFRPLYKFSIYIFVFNFLLLTFIGSAIVAQPYIILGQIFTFLYFGFFIIFWPIISFIEFILFIL